MAQSTQEEASLGRVRWIGKCEVDVSKMPRFPRQRRCKVGMVMVFVNYMRIYI